MSEPISSENPVVLFGDVGPDVVKLSQIYDPDSDEFSLSKDELAVVDKQYYIRSYSDKTVSFTEVSGVVPGVDTPEANDWYEQNISGFVSTGKYIPAEKSLVVVDVATDEYEERTILIVESVDEVTLKSKLVPHNCGAEGSTTARALKYGNGDYQLYFQTEVISPGDEKVVLTPDRKLMLYGCRYYMYMLRCNGKVISTPVPESILTSENGLVPYISPTAKRVTITGDDATKTSYYGNYAGCSFDSLCGTRFNSVVVPTAPLAPGDTHPLIPTFDSVYRHSPVGPYWFFEAAHYELTKDTIYQHGKMYFSKSATNPSVYIPKTVTVGASTDPLHDYEYVDDRTYEVQECEYALTTDTTWKATTTYYERDTATGCYLETDSSKYPSGSKPVELGLYVQTTVIPEPDPGECAYYFTAGTVVGYLLKVETDLAGSSSGGYHKYTAVQIQQRADKAFGSGVTGYIKSATASVSYTDEDHVYYPDSCYLKAGFSIVSGETVDMEVYELRENSTDLRMVMNVTLTTKEATVLDGTDTKTKRISYLDADLEGCSTAIWSIGMDETVAEFTKRIHPKLMMDDGSEIALELNTPGLYIYGLETINTMPASGKQYHLLFKYFPNPATAPNTLPYINSNSSKGFVSCNKTVEVQDSAALTIRKISLLPVWDHREHSVSNGVYTFKYLVYRTDFESPVIMSSLGSVLEDLLYDGSSVTGAKSTACDVTDAKYLDDSGIVRPSGSPTELIGYIQHANISLFVRANGYTNAKYSQRVALQLQNWEHESKPAKWLLGDNTDNWEAADMPYGNPNAGIRPYIEFDGAIAEEEPTVSGGSVSYPKPFRVGMKFASSKDSFLTSFYHNANPPSISVSLTSGVEPGYFNCRSFMTRDDYIAITNDDPNKDLALEELKDCYYDVGTGKKVMVTVGITKVTNYKIKVIEGVDFYQNDGTSWYKADLAIGSFISVADKKKYFLKHVVEVNSGYIAIGSGGGAWCEPFSLVGAYMTKEADDEFGGAVPFVFGNEDPSKTSNKYNTQCMGTVIMEFVGTDSSLVYKHLYGVPVEVRHPYQTTKDPTYAANKNYYVYGYTNAVESVGGHDVPVFNPALSVTIDDEHPPKNRFYRIVNVAVGDEITNTPLAVWEEY